MMKPIEQFQSEFIKLLIKAESKLGGPLTVSVTSELETKVSLFKPKTVRNYKCVITTNNL